MKYLILVLTLLLSSCAQLSNLKYDYSKDNVAESKRKRVLRLDTQYKLKMQHPKIQEMRVKPVQNIATKRGIRALSRTNLFSEVLDGQDKYDKNAKYDLKLNIVINHIDDRNAYVYLPWMILSMGTLTIIPLRVEHSIRIDASFVNKKGKLVKSYSLSESPVYWMQLFLLPFSKSEYWEDTPAFPGTVYENMLKRVVVMAQKDGVL